MKIGVFLILCGLLTTPKIVFSNELLGFWKSDEQKTLASMNQVEGITDKARELFEEDFFGHLVTEYRESDTRSFFDNGDNVEELLDYHSYKVLEVNPSRFRVLVYDPLEKKELEKTLWREGDCYYIHVSKWQFKEYFCKILSTAITSGTRLGAAKSASP